MPPETTTSTSTPGTAEKVRAFTNRAHKKLAHSPLIMWFLGGLVLILWASGTVVQIQTSEFLALGTNQVVHGVQLSVFLQPWLIITSQAPFDQQTPWMYGWIVEAFTLCIALALVASFTKIATVNRALAKFFIGAALVLVALNSWADFAASPGSNGLVRFLVALAIGLIVTVGLPLGIGLIEHGFELYG